MAHPRKAGEPVSGSGEKLELPPDDATTRSHGDLFDRTDTVLDEEHRQHGFGQCDPATAIGADQLAVDRHSRTGW